MIPNTLPGTRFITRDNKQSYTPPTPSGDRILIVAPALDGPSNVPVPLQGIDLETIFGPVAFNTTYPAPGPAGFGATGMAVLGSGGAAGTVASITVSAPGTGYQGGASVSLTGGGGTGAAATATVNPSGVVTGFVVTSPGTGYTSAPVVAVTGVTALDQTKNGQYSYNGLVRYAQEVILGGGSNIFLLRVGGTQAQDAVHTVFENTATVKSMNGGLHYNGSSLTCAIDPVAGVTLTIVSQPSVKATGTTVFNYPASMTYDAVARQFNADNRNRSFYIVTTPASASKSASASSGVATVTATVTGGSYDTLGPNDTFYPADGSKSALYAAVTAQDGVFDQIDSANVNILIVPDLYADDAIAAAPATIGGVTVQPYNRSFAQDLALFCYVQSRDSYPMVGIIGLRPQLDTTRPGVRSRINQLTTVNTTGYDDATTKRVNVAQFIQNGMPYQDPTLPAETGIDIGRHLSIVAGADIVYPNLKLNSYVGSAATLYAGLVASLDPQISATNQTVTSAVSLAYSTMSRLERNQLNAGINASDNPAVVQGGAYVTLGQRQPEQNAISVTEDVTAASGSSQYDNLSTVRIVQKAEVVVENIAVLFIGRPNSKPTVAALDAELKAGLDVIASSGALAGTRGSGYDYTIQSGTDSTNSLGIISISMWLRPAYEIKRIDTTVTVQ